MKKNKSFGFYLIILQILLSSTVLLGKDPTEPFGVTEKLGLFFPPQLNAGVFDSTFDGDGVAVTDFAQMNDNGNDAAIQTDGKIVVAGTAVLSSSSVLIPAVVRYHADGTLDTTFDGDGRVTINLSGTVRGVAVQSDGKIVIGGFIVVSSTVNDRFIARFNPNGSLDTTFGTNGIFRTPIGKPGLDRGDVGIQADGKIVTVGTERVGTSTIDVFSVMRFNTNGTLDTTFDEDGRVTTAFVANDRGFKVEILSDGKILAVGYANGGTLFALARYNSDGSLDTSFDGDGKVTTSNSPSAQSFNSAVQPDGKYLVGGSTLTTPQDGVIIRYNTDGSVDTTFGTNGRVSIDFNNGSNDSISSISVQEDGKIIGVGFASTVATESAMGVVGLKPDGTLDPTFGQGGKLLVKFSPTFDIPLGTLIQPDGKFVICGYGTFTTTLRDFAVVRLNTVNRPNLFDFDGDGRDDISVFRNGEWYLNRSTAGFAALNWGLASDKLAPADYDGDGKTDVAVWREGIFADFYILNSSNNTVRTEQFGQTGDVLTVGDWDGDNRADLSVYRDAAVGNQSYFYYRASSNNPNGNVTYLPFGTTGNRPMRGDFDGDSRHDLAVFRPSNNVWYIRRSSDNQITYQTWGIASDKFVPADYDGDLRTDLAVSRNGIWYILQSSNNQAVYQTFGLPSDQLVPGDYNGDGRADIAVFRNGLWYIQNSTNSFAVTQFGLSANQPIPTAFFP